MSDAARIDGLQKTVCSDAARAQQATCGPVCRPRHFDGASLPPPPAPAQPRPPHTARRDELPEQPSREHEHMLKIQALTPTIDTSTALFLTCRLNPKYRINEATCPCRWLLWPTLCGCCGPSPHHRDTISPITIPRPCACPRSQRAAYTYCFVRRAYATRNLCGESDLGYSVSFR